ncbi:MarR family transcriptional regulator [Herbiconiux sp.]|uniref:MarR family winged helix-turn-helix transcriptional regulator n=1 Tax=Herbiconiux sp. TaxID=1871186 RepID=UPI0025BC4CF7|nr:MarR family transcriptional regulator [Herbiconiux sp.]
MTSTGTSPLDSMACFALYSASNAVGQAHRAALAPWNLTYTQYIALVVLADAAAPADASAGAGASAGLTVGELGTRLGLDSGTLSPLLRRLEARGLVARERVSADERVVTVSLTDAGRTTRAELAEAVACLTPAYGLGSVDELHQLIASLRGIAEGMRSQASALTSA